MGTEQEIRKVLDTYFQAVETNSPELFQKAFAPGSAVTHASSADGTVSTVSLEDFIQQVKELHAQHGTVSETAKSIQMDVATLVASVRVDFIIRLGEIEVDGTDLFHLAQLDHGWAIQHKLYLL